MLTRLRDSTAIDPNNASAPFIKLNLVRAQRDSRAAEPHVAAIPIRRVAPTILRLHIHPELLTRNRVRRRNHHQPYRIAADHRKLWTPCNRHKITRTIRINLDPKITTRLDKRLTPRTRPAARTVAPSNQDFLTLHQCPTHVHQIQRRQIHYLSRHLRTLWRNHPQIVRALWIMNLGQFPVCVRIRPDSNYATASQSTSANNKNQSPTANLTCHNITLIQQPGTTDTTIDPLCQPNRIHRF